MNKIALKIIKKEWKYTLLFTVLALSMTLIFFRRVEPNQFLFIHDQYLRLNFYEVFINSYFLRISENLNVINAWYLVWYFWDTLYFLIAYFIGLPLLFAEKIQFFSILLFSMFGSFIGFRKLATYFDRNISIRNIVVIALWYCFNPYTLFQWHTGNFNFGFSLAYTLAPIIIYYLHTALFSSFNIRRILIFVTLLFLSSFVFWIFAVLIFYLIIYSLFFLILNFNLFKIFLKNGFITVLIYFPLVSFILFSIIYQLMHSSGDSNGIFSPTYELQQGGMLYQILLYSSWAIYVEWFPRSLFPFASYYFSPMYLISICGLYGIVISGLFLHFRKKLTSFSYKSKNSKRRLFINLKDKMILTSTFLYFVSVFFAKAGQAPFGELFVYLYTYFPPFTVFRSADGRFGFIIVLSISLLLLYINKYFNKIFFVIGLTFTTILLNIHFFNGNAIFGVNDYPKFVDRITFISKHQHELSKYLNSQNIGSGYILTIPSVQFGEYFFDKDEIFIGQDLLQKQIIVPFLYHLDFKCTSQTCSISERTNHELGKLIKNNQFENMNKFPIKYILLRNDIRCTNCVGFKEDDLKNFYPIVFENAKYRLYKVHNGSPIITVDNTEIRFNYRNPTKYSIKIKNLKDKKNLNLFLSYNDDWKVYIDSNNSTDNCGEYYFKYSNYVIECNKGKSLFDGDEVYYLLKNSLFDQSHRINHGYANTWTLDTNYIKEHLSPNDYSLNEDGSININLVVYFQPQSYLYMYFFISLITFTSIVLYLIFNLAKMNK